MKTAKKVFGSGEGLVGYADDKRKEKAGPPVLGNVTWDSAVDHAGKGLPKMQKKRR